MKESVLTEIGSRFREHLITDLYLQIERTSPELGLHCQNVAEYSKKIAKITGANHETQQTIYQIGKIHDLGKIDEEIKPLLKIPFGQRITDAQYEIFIKHAKRGAEMALLAGIPNDWAYIIESHHEDYNGKGYPNKLVRGEIPLASQIIRIADSFAAILERKDSNVQYAQQQILAGMGKQYNPMLKEPFLQFVDDISKIPVSFPIPVYSAVTVKTE